MVAQFSSASLAPNAPQPLHPFIRQLFAEGYNVGDRVVGRCLEVTPDGVKNPTTSDWWATLTSTNLNLTEYRWRSGRCDPNGTNHPDGLMWLQTQNNAHFGVYYNINAGRKNTEVKRFYTLAWEDDKNDFNAQQSKIDSFGLAPTTVVRTKRSLHTKYRILDAKCVKEQWTAYQEEMSLTMASDPTIKDLPRLMRCAGFNHVKWSEGVYVLTPCVLEVCEPERVYTLAQVKEAMAAFAPQPFSQLRYRAYNFAIGKLNQRKNGIPYPLIDPEEFRTCPDSELAEKDQRLRLYARLCEQEHKGTGDGTDPATAWTMSLRKARKRYKAEVEVETVDATPEQTEALDDPKEHLVLRWARLYGLGWRKAKYGGRYAWDTCRCPVHGSSSNSTDNLHINRFDKNYHVGSVSCKSGCDSKEITKAFRQLAKDAGDETWNWALKYKADDKAKNNIVPYEPEENVNEIEALQTQLRSFTFKPDIQVNERYFPFDLWRQFSRSGILLLRAPKGSGKSEQIAKLINLAKKESRPVIVFTPRITLGKEQASRWDIIYIEGVKETKYTIDNAPTIGCCFDSIAKLLGRDLTGTLLILDEAELGLAHLITSTTCEDSRPRLLATFEHIVKSVLETNGQVILADADLSDISVNYVRSLAPKDTPIFTVTNTHKGNPWNVKFIEGDPSPLERRLIHSVNAGNKVAIALDNQKKAEQYQTLIERECPGKKVIRIDSTTSYTERILRLIRNINGELLKEAPDVLIFTPSMGVGVSIDVPWFDEVYGFCFGQLEPSQFRQMPARIRQPVPRYIWSKKANPNRKGSKSFNPNEIKRHYFDYHTGSAFVLKLAFHLSELYSSATDISAKAALQRYCDLLPTMLAPDGTWDNSHLDLFANVMARRNFALKNLAKLLREELIEEGHNVEEFLGTPEGFCKIDATQELSVSIEIPVTPSVEALKLLEEYDTDKGEAVTAEPDTQQALDPVTAADSLTNNISECCDDPVEPVAPPEVQRIKKAIAYKSADRDANNRLKATFKEMAEVKLQQEAKTWERTNVVDSDVALEIKRDPFATEDERRQAQKTFLSQTLPGVELTADYVKKAVLKDRRRWLTYQRNFWYLTHPEETKALDRKTWLRNLKDFDENDLVFLPDLYTHEPKFEVLRRIGLLRFITDTGEEYTATHPAVVDFFDACLTNSRKLKTAWGIGVSRKHTTPIQLLNRLLEKIGLRLKMTRQVRKGGERVRYYVLDETLKNDPDRLATLAALDKYYGNDVTAEPDTQQSLNPVTAADSITNNISECCDAPEPKVNVTSPPDSPLVTHNASLPAVSVRGKRIRIFPNGLYSEAIGVVVMGDSSSDCVKARIISGEYAGQEWIVPSGEYALLGAG